jgi:hypothetical protein
VKAYFFGYQIYQVWQVDMEMFLFCDCDIFASKMKPSKNLTSVGYNLLRGTLQQQKMIFFTDPKLQALLARSTNQWIYGAKERKIFVSAISEKNRGMSYVLVKIFRYSSKKK